MRGERACNVGGAHMEYAHSQTWEPDSGSVRLWPWARFSWFLVVEIRPGGEISYFPTNNGLTCVAQQAPVAGFYAFRSDIEENFDQALDEVPELAERVRAGSRAERWYGTADLTNFSALPVDPGALVGDAGFHKDPILAQGISDAFRDAQLLADAIDAGFAGHMPLGEALRDYERRRNEAALPGYEQNCAAASFMPPPPEVMAQRAAVHAAGQPVP